VPGHPREPAAGRDPPKFELTADEARLLQLRAQGFVGTPDRKAGALGVLDALGVVQLDTISVLARTHELVPQSRIGPLSRADIEDAFWHRPARAFEYWAHAMCLLPIEEWPWSALRRRLRAKWTHPRRPHDPKAMREVLRILRAQGPITSEALGGSRDRSPRPAGHWWHWSPLKIAVERLLATGEVVCVERRGFRRVYDLAERAIPARLLRRDPSDEECRVHHVVRAAERLGVATAADLASYFEGMSPGQAIASAEEAGLVKVSVEGWNKEAWALPRVFEKPVRGRHRTTLVSPFDSLVWGDGLHVVKGADYRGRERTKRVFGFDMLFEAYVPAAKRVHGYFTMPLLAGGRLVGRVDPAREGTTLVAKRVTLEGPAAVEHATDALVEAASWVGCDDVRIDRVTPAKLRAPLVAAAKRAG